MSTVQEVHRSNIHFFPGKVDVDAKSKSFKQFKSLEVVIGDLKAWLVGRLTSNLTDSEEWLQTSAVALTGEGILQGNVGNFAREGYYLLEEIIGKKDLNSQSRLVSARLVLANSGVFSPFIYHPDHPTAPWVIESWIRSQSLKEVWRLMVKPEPSTLGLIRIPLN